MTLSPHEIAAAREVYETYWKSYFSGNIETFAATIDEAFSIIGTSEGEISFGKEAVAAMYQAQFEEVVGKAEVRNRQVKEIPTDDKLQIIELSDIYVMTDSDWSFYSKFRLSTLLHKTPDGWKLLQQHGSLPDMRVGEGETVAVEKISKENFELRDAVRRRTVELEHKSRELEIEAALERVRSRSMAMHESEELADVIQVVYDELVGLSIPVDHAGFILDYKERDDMHIWLADHQQGVPTEITIPYFDSPHWNSYVEAKSKGENFFANLLDLEEKNKFYKDLIELIPSMPEETVQNIFDKPGLTISTVLLDNVGLYIENYTGTPFTEAENATLMRFGKAFQQTYTRFLDLQKAESQARESEIQLALERVRARTMAMQHSDELQEASHLLDEQVRALGIRTWGCAFNIYGEEDSTEWFGNEAGVLPTYTVPHVGIFKEYYDRGQKGESLFIKEFRGQECIDHYEYMSSLPVIGEVLKTLKNSNDGFPTYQIDHVVYFKYGYVLFITREHVSEAHDIFMRFAKVFEQTYTRFLDLQKAEDQTEEAKIQLALERVRARIMAMHESDELLDAAAEMFQQMANLSVTPERLNICFFKEEERTLEVWPTDESGMAINKLVTASLDEPTTIFKAFTAWKEKKNSIIIDLHGKELEEWVAYVREAMGLTIKEETLNNRRIHSMAFFSHGLLMTTSSQPIPDKSLQLLERFTQVFDQAYIRFLDLQKAEAQAREAQIESALEKIRSSSLAMYRTDDLSDVVTVLFEQMQGLHVDMDFGSVSIFIFKENSKNLTQWIQLPNGVESVSVPYFDHPILSDLHEALENRKDYFSKIYKVEQKNSWIEKGFELTDYKYLPEEFKKALLAAPGYAMSIALAKHSGICIPSFQGMLPPADDIEIMKRVSKVFEQAYIRFLDLQKAEAQAREAKIETALEKVRSRTMGMQKSDELADVADVLFNEMNDLVHNLWTCGFVLCEKDREEDEWWLGLEEGFTRGFFLPNINDYAHSHLYEGWLKNDDFRTVQLEGDDLLAHYDWLMKIPVAKNIFDEMEAAGMERPEWQKLHAAYFSKGYLVIITREPCAEEAIFKRFAQVFDLTYTRFLDLQKAESQAREAQIENALEKVRSRSLAMQSPDELIEVAELLREEMGALGVEELETSSIYIHDDESEKTQCWFTIKDTDKPGNNISDQMTIDLQDTWVGREMSDFYRSTQKHTSIPMQGEQRIEWIRYCEDKSDLFSTGAFYGDTIPDRTYHLYKFSNGYIGAASPGEISDESWDLLKRATSVFSFAFTRFLDLKKAKEQTREAQIELSLERIRAQVTGMQESSDLLDIVVAMRSEFVNLGHEAHYFWHMRWLPDTYKKAMTSGDGTKIAMVMTLPRHIHGDITEVAAWEKTKDPIHVLAMDVDVAVDYIDKMISLGDFERVDPQAPSLDDIRHIGGLTFVMARTTHGEIGFSLPGVVPEPPKDAVDTLTRFAGVFDLAYRRFEDLKKAEAQSRENRIELALERTRNQSMLMQHSDEIKGISDVFHQQLLELNIPTEFSYVWLPDESKNNHQFWASWAERKKGDLIFKSKQVTYALDKTEPYTAACYKAWEDQENVHLEFIPSGNIPDFFNTWAELLEGAENLSAKNFTEGIFYAEAYMRYGCFGINVRRELSTEEKQVLKRFSIEFERAYTRFLDLQKAEARARESQVELSLERIRGKVTAMQESSDLFDIVVEMRKEFISLGNEADYFWHMRWLPEVYEMSMTSEDGNRLGMVIQVPKFVHDQIDALAKWEKTDSPIIVLPLDAKQGWNYLENMNTYGHYEKADPNAPTQQDIEHIGGLTFIIARTTHGEIGYSLPGMVPNPPKEALDTLMRFAGVFDLAYKRFEDLKTAEKDLIEIKRARQKAEDALIELKATQTQLVQQEKLASLGQLTAGIAHEIKNPLNFVNNFSEVSVELIDEAFDELKELKDSDAKEEVIAILNDVRDNLTKVHEHGTRADGIVKSMLQHSRGGSGKMEPTNLNALIKEYVNLAFHGMRANKNSINVKLEFDLDENLGQVNLIGEDFSRVVLNLCNNAFDAMREKSKTEEDYNAVLSVSLRREGDAVNLSISDNGPGIPDDIKDKVFQPFFTTKKGTDGTGLGLSITNDIVKAHGGEMDIVSSPGTGTTFSIHLSTKQP
jgi:signal transduction histidine kinase